MNHNENDNDITEKLLPVKFTINSTKQIFPNPTKEKKALIFFVLIIILTVGNNYYSFESFFSIPFIPKGFCYEDSLFTLTQEVTNFFKIHTQCKNVLLIISSFAADLTIIISMIYWTFFFKDEQLCISVFAFYLFRFIIMKIFLLDYPRDYIFTYPGVRSLFVSYLKTNDFFFSGHTGFPLIIFCDCIGKNYKKIAYLSLFTFIIEFFSMLALRGHYSIDLVVGAFIGVYVYFMVLVTLKYVKNNKIKN